MELKTPVVDITRMGEYTFLSLSDESKCTGQRDYHRVFTWRENGARFHSSYETKVNRLGGKGSLANCYAVVHHCTSLIQHYRGMSFSGCFGPRRHFYGR
ncbi:hypothetical protein TNCV_17061 [Trichonephila clavipes]|nr:hypothetical protein TNCV_17061 [Trichonephila clavipes]